MRFAALAIVSAAAVATFTAASPAAVVFNAEDGVRSAQVAFDVSGSTLTVTLTNTSLVDAMVPVDVLTGVFFNANVSLASLTRTSAVLSTGSSVVHDAAPVGGIVGGEWAFKAGLTGAAPASVGISSAGLGLFSPGDVFPGANLDGAASVNGLNYGIVSLSDNPATGNSPVTGGVPLIRGGVVFTFGNLPASFNVNAISGVVFQYGTALTEPQITHVPTEEFSNVVATVPVPAALPAGVVMLSLASAVKRRILK